MLVDNNSTSWTKRIPGVIYLKVSVRLALLTNSGLKLERMGFVPTSTSESVGRELAKITSTVGGIVVTV